MKYKNKFVFHGRISEDKFRELVKLFVLKSNHINGIELFWSKAYIFASEEMPMEVQWWIFMLYYRRSLGDRLII
ncbi:MAG: hypothetical protein KA140_07995 [Caldisericia bacterium]|nr:hypothetical protein [Caldisericia bacterium]